MPNDPTMLEYSPDCYCCRIDTWLSDCAAAESECADDAALDHEQKSRAIMPVTPPLSSTRRSISPSKRRRIEVDDNADEDHTLPPDSDPTPRPGRSMSEQRPFVILPPPPDQRSIPGSHSHDQSRGARTKSTGSGFSPHKQRSTSPVKKPQDMRALSKPIEMRALSNPKHQLSPDMANLYRRIQDIVEFQNAFVPAEAQEAITGALQETGDWATSWPGNWFFSSPEGTTDSGSQDRRAAAEAELAALLKLKATADECLDESVSEAAWNMDVHSPILQLATAGSGVRRLVITTARIAPAWLATVGPASSVPGTASTPSISSSTASSVGRPHLATEGAGANAAVAAGKMVDFALVLSESEGTPLGSAILNAVRAAAPDERSVNQSTYMPLTLRPLGVSIETKASTNLAEGRVQLGLWAAAWFARMQALISVMPAAKGIPTAMPVILVFEHRWALSFVCDRGVKFEFIGEVLIGDTRSLVGLYKLLAVLRVLVQWMDTDLRAFFEDLFDV
ncbi:hypothetical protein GGTG_01698 [Gaeumannomyces tritici R3-111a-1]|uniref:PD-(D/E)XK nuclease-like domain-containing protein n=1 Tax=Gaeumannomyces tritici (strain R3-111a-1) TaxID=644352 RepID=J3NKB8_GAET3|nr:hypothetical protein GGTG_01698 [Gaeumannomyces tritici R3-111a-1]EJT81722.1 hypothetical protein GGTG_01698 [Gaeumannomyces tritici R3-111a-1]